MPNSLDAAACTTIAAGLGIELSADEAAAYAAIASVTLQTVDLVDLLPLPPARPDPLRARWRTPSAEENPLGAWQVRGELRTRSDGPLAGRSVALKDNVLLAGAPLANGSTILGDYRPRHDAAIVTRLLEAGATIVGKTVCEAYCFSAGSHTSASGVVRNPHDPTRSAGGSSSGSGVVVATGEADMAIGCDQGGSIRVPAAFCGIVGLKPSWGLVPYTGILGMNATIDHAGPMTRSVTDNALLLEVIAGPDGEDPRQHGARTGPYRAALGAPLAGLRIGVLREGFGIPGGEPEVDDCVRAAAGRLGALGARVSEVSVPVHTIAGGVTFAALQGMIASMFLLDGAQLEHHVAVDEEYVERQRAWRANTAALPPNIRLMLIVAEHLRRTHGFGCFARAMNRVPLIRSAYDEALRAVDVLLLPTTPMTAPPLPRPDAGVDELIGAAFAPVANTGVFNHTHHPALSLPCGTHAGLPVGMMLVGRHFEEATLYRAAYAFEQGR